MTSRPRSASVLMPTWQGAAFLGPALEALARQDFDRPWDFTAVDSGSTDGTLEILERHRAGFPVPFRVFNIDKVEFDHGDTRNLLASQSQGDLLVYLTQDAVPLGVDWLATLALNFDDPSVGAAYCRNSVRPQADLLTRVFSALDPGYARERREVRLPSAAAYRRLSAHEKRLLYNFNDVASAVRRELWERHPFPRTPFGEDVLMARALLEAGFTVVYDERAAVEHSHDYGVEETAARARIDAAFNAEWLERICVASREDAEVLVARQLARDREALAESGLSGNALEAELARAEMLRRAAFVGLWEGGRTERRRPPTALLENPRFHVLYVVHGFPPDTWAGTEVYTLNLAREMERLGHRVTVLARADGPADSHDELGLPPDFSVVEGSFEGLRVLRLVHRLKHKSLRDSYDQPEAARAFREVLLREKPDLVHFQHLIHTSAGLVQQAKDFNLPTVLHCHDYWALCARVQMIRPNGVRCARNMGSGCFLCVRERGLSQIDRLHRLDRHLQPGRRPLDPTSQPDPAFPRDPTGQMDPTGKKYERPRRAFWTGFGDLAARQEFVEGAYRAADLRISPSRFLRQRLIDQAGFDPESLIYSDNGLRTELVAALRKAPDPEGYLRFGFVGSLVWYKGLDVLIEAMNALSGRRCRLDVFGDFRPENEPYHARWSDLAHAGNVRFSGRFNNSELSEVYRGIDVLVVPSLWWENSPISIHEAFLARTPVVASGIGGMAEFVRDGVDGLHFRPGDAADLASTLGRFLDEPDLLARLSRNFPEVKSIGDNARELEFRYRGLLCRRAAARPRLLIDVEGTKTAARRGPVEEQGAGMVLLRPGGAAVEYDLALATGGRREILVEVYALAGEHTVELGGRFFLGGAPLGRLDVFTAGGDDSARELVFAAEVGHGDHRLVVDTKAGVRGRDVFLRIRRVAVGDEGAFSSAPPSAAERREDKAHR